MSASFDLNGDVHGMLGSRLVRFGVVFLLLVALPFVLPYVELSTEVLIFALALVGLDILVGYTGFVSFGHAAYFGGGAYAAAIFTTDVLGSGAVVPTLLVVVVVSAVLGAVLGYLCLRRSGVYFAMLTLAMAELVYFVVKQLSWLTGGTDGLTGIPTPVLTLFGLLGDASVELSGVTYYALVAALFLVGLYVARRVAASPFGLTLRTIRENEERAEFLGYNTERYKLAAFVLSAVYCGVAGSLLAMKNGAISLSLLHWALSGDFLIMLILGGMGTVFGPAFGALIVIILQELLSAKYPQTYQFYTGLIFILFVLFLPGGLWNLDRNILSFGYRRVREYARSFSR